MHPFVCRLQHPVQVVEGLLLGQQQNTAWRVSRFSARDMTAFNWWEPISIHYTDAQPVCRGTSMCDIL